MLFPNLVILYRWEVWTQVREKIANLIPLTFSGGLSLSREHGSRSRIVRASLRRARHLLGPTPSLLLADAGFLGYITEDQVLGLRSAVVARTRERALGILQFAPGRCGPQLGGPSAFCTLPLGFAGGLRARVHPKKPPQWIKKC